MCKSTHRAAALEAMRLHNCKQATVEYKVVVNMNNYATKYSVLRIIQIKLKIVS